MFLVVVVGGVGQVFLFFSWKVKATIKLKTKKIFMKMKMMTMQMNMKMKNADEDEGKLKEYWVVVSWQQVWQYYPGGVAVRPRRCGSTTPGVWQYGLRGVAVQAWHISGGRTATPPGSYCHTSGVVLPHLLPRNHHPIFF